MLSSLDEGSYSRGAIRWIVRGVGLGVELDAIGAKGSSCIKVLEIRTDKDRGADAPSVELAEDLCEEVGGELHPSPHYSSEHRGHRALRSPDGGVPLRRDP